MDIHSVGHEQHLKLLLVVNEEGLEAIGSDVLGSSVRTITNSDEGAVSLQFNKHK